MDRKKYSKTGLKVPTRLVRSPKRQNYRARKSLEQDGPSTKLLEILVAPHFYSLEYRHLGIDKEFAQPEYLRDHLMLKAWKTVLLEKIEKPYFWKFEVGRGGRGKGELKVHLLAEDDAGLPHIRRGGEVIKPINETEEDYRRLMAYLLKPDEEESDESIARYNNALKRLAQEGKYKRVPYTSGYEWGIWK